MDLSELTAALVADLPVGRFRELIERARERMAELDAEEPESLQEWRRNPFDTSGLHRSFVPAWYDPERQNILQEYIRRQERLEIARMIQEAEEQVVTPLTYTDWRREFEGSWTSPNHEREGTTDDRRTESDGTQRRRAAGMGHGGPGDGGHSGDQVRGTVAGRACGFRHEWGDPQAGGVRSDGGADRDDDTDGRWINIPRFAPITQEARDRAESLLLEHLDDEQAATWQTAGIFIVDTPSGNRYRVERDGNQVRNLDIRTSYCLQAVGSVPRADTALAHKLWLEADEAGFLEAANHFAYPNEWDRDGIPVVGTMGANLNRGRLEPQGMLHLETLAGARLWMESHNWEAELTTSWGPLPLLMGQPRPDPTYKVNGMVSDERTVELLRQVAIERDERHAAAFEAGVERQRALEEHLASLDCPMEVHVREGCCDAP